MGWLILLALFALALAALRVLGVRGGLLKAAAAALLVGASGYALQGRPDLAGSPAPGSAGRDFVPLAEARHAFYGNFSAEEPWLRLSEGLARAGNTEDAAGLLQNAVRRYPGSAQLWIGLGNALVDHAHGITPPAELAYQRAARLQPDHPAAPFFYGLALARSGDPQGAVAVWKKILATAPPDASWRPLIEGGIAALSGTAPGAPSRPQPPKEASPR
jgi:cytochrome c-type biogenesis protein CcmH